MERLGLSMLNLYNSIYSTGIIAHLKYIWQIFSTPMAVSPHCNFLCCTEAFYFHIIPPANSWCCFRSRKFLPMPNSWYVFSVLFQQFFLCSFLFFIFLQVRHCNTLASLFFLFRTALPIQNIFCISTWNSVSFSSSEKCHWKFDRHCIESGDCF